MIKYLLNERSYGHFAYKNGFEINFGGRLLKGDILQREKWLSPIIEMVQILNKDSTLTNK